MGKNFSVLHFKPVLLILAVFFLSPTLKAQTPKILDARLTDKKDSLIIDGRRLSNIDTIKISKQPIPKDDFTEESNGRKIIVLLKGRVIENGDLLSVLNTQGKEGIHQIKLSVQESAVAPNQGTNENREANATDTAPVPEEAQPEQEEPALLVTKPEDLNHPSLGKVFINLDNTLSGKDLKIAESAQQITAYLMLLEKNGNKINKLTIEAHLNKKELISKGNQSRFVSTAGIPNEEFILIENKKGQDEPPTRIDFSRENGIIGNAFREELLKLALLKDEIIKSRLVNRDDIIIRVFTKAIERNPIINFKVDADLNTRAFHAELEKIRLVEELPLRLSRLFPSATITSEFPIFENPNARYDKENNRIIFAFSNYETDYQGLKDTENFIRIIRPEINKFLGGNNNKVKEVHLVMNSYESANFFTFPSERAYQGELGNEVEVPYHLKSADAALKTEKIKKGEISILQQELLKLYELKKLLSLPAATDIKFVINYGTNEDYIDTQVMLFLN